MEPLNNLLLISTFFLWLVVLGMGLVIYALTRQIGILYERIAPAGALAVNQKLSVKGPAPSMSLQTIDAKLITIGDKHPRHRSQLLFFLSPTCPVCKTLLPALKSAAKAEQSWVSVVLCSDGMELDHQQFITAYGLQDFPYVVSELLGQSYGVAKLPYAVLIDEDANIVSMGIINSREHLDSLFEAKDRNMSSIQEFLQLENSPSTIQGSNP